MSSLGFSWVTTPRPQAKDLQSDRTLTPDEMTGFSEVYHEEVHRVGGKGGGEKNSGSRAKKAKDMRKHTPGWQGF